MWGSCHDGRDALDEPAASWLPERHTADQQARPAPWAATQLSHFFCAVYNKGAREHDPTGALKRIAANVPDRLWPSFQAARAKYTVGCSRLRGGDCPGLPGGMDEQAPGAFTVWARRGLPSSHSVESAPSIPLQIARFAEYSCSNPLVAFVGLNLRLYGVPAREYPSGLAHAEDRLPVRQGWASASRARWRLQALVLQALQTLCRRRQRRRRGRLLGSPHGRGRK